MKLLLFPFDFVPTSCRKIPWINIYAQVQHDKEQEMIGSVSQSENAPKITLSDFTEPEELLDKELDTRVIGMCICHHTQSPVSSKVLCPPNILSLAGITCMCHQTVLHCKTGENTDYNDIILFQNP